MSDIASSESRKSRVFISYSRKDMGFAEKLVSNLEQQDFNVLLDKTNIAPGEDWQKRLANLINATDAVVMALSKNSAKSEVCKWEMQEALRQGKRILPLVISELDISLLPPELTRLNFIFFKGNEFDKPFASLVEALKTDIAWSRFHTKIGEQAVDWQNGHRSKSQVLRGAALDEAERWIANRPKGANLPTDVQRQFIAASRAAASNRQRGWTLGTLIAAILSVALAAWGLSNARLANEKAQLAIANSIEADKQRVLAEKNFKQAEAEKKLADAATLSAQIQTKRVINSLEAVTTLSNDLIVSVVRRLSSERVNPKEVVRTVLEKVDAMQAKLDASDLPDDTFQRGRWFMLNEFSTNIADLGDKQKALEIAVQANKLAETLWNKNPKDEAKRFDFAISYATLSRRYYEAQKYPEAVEAATKGNDYYDDLPSVNQTTLTRNRSALYELIGDVLMIQGKTSTALNNFQTSINLTSLLGAETTTDELLRRDYIFGYRKLANAFSALNNVEGAKMNYIKAIELAEAQVVQHSANIIYESDLLGLYEDAAGSFNRHKDKENALKYYALAYPLRVDVNSQYPADAGRARILMVDCWALADLGLEPLRYYTEALQILKKLKAENKLAAEDEQWIPKAEALIAKLSVQTPSVAQ